MIKIKAIPLSLIVLVVILTWTVSTSANNRSPNQSAAASQRALAMAVVRDDPVNTPPTADDQSVVTNEDAPMPITLTGNDPDAGDILEYIIVSNPGHGSLADPPPDVIYTPDTGYNGEDSFTFKINDGTDDSDPATVSITVNPMNGPPTANDQNVVTNEDTPTLITLTGSDPDAGDPLTFEIVSDPGHGSLTGSPPAVTYTPAVGYAGEDIFTFKINDGTDDSNIATVSITVNPVNDPPTADNQSVVTNENTPTLITLTGNDPDAGDILEYIIVSNPGHGSLTGSPPALTYTPAAGYTGPDSFTFNINDGAAGANAADVTYTPETDYTGPDSFTFKINDGTVDSNTATVLIAVNGPPSVAAPIPDVFVNVIPPPPDHVIELFPVFEDDEDEDNKLIFEVVSGDNAPIFSNVSITGNGNLTLKFANGVKGSATVIVEATDKGGLSEQDQFMVTVNGPPTVENEIADVLVNMNAADKVINLYHVFEDVEDDDEDLDYTLFSGGSAAIFDGLPIISNGNLTLKFKANIYGSAIVVVEATDTGGLSKNDVFNVKVNAQPQLDLNGNGSGTGFFVTHAAGTAAVKIADNTLAISDPDNAQMASATVEITNLKHANNEILDANVGGTNISKDYNAQSGELTLTGLDSIANYQAVLRSVTYQIAPAVTNPNIEERNIEFSVHDGLTLSDKVVSKVKIIAPRISISATTSSSPIPVGAQAVFNVTITNNAGSNVALQNIKVTSTDGNDDCDKTTGLPTLAPGASHFYVCKTLYGVQSNYDNNFSVTANDVELATPVSATSDPASVRVISPIVVDIYHTTLEGTLPKGQDANFNITITNPTTEILKNFVVQATIQYYDNVVGDYKAAVPVPACSKNVPSDLAAGMVTSYQCMIPDVQASFRIRVDAAGSLDTNMMPVEDFDTETILVPDLLFEVSADPFIVSAGISTPVKFNVSMSNLSNLELNLTSLQSDQHGSLFAPGLTNNTCASMVKTIPVNGTRTCSYVATVTAQPPAFINTISAAASYGVNKSLTVNDGAIVIVGDFSPLDVNLVANPSSLVAPGGVVELTAEVTNLTTSELKLDELKDSVLGDLDGIGDCDISQPIPAGETYTCTYTATISGKAPGDVVEHTLTAVSGPTQASATTSISITTEVHTELFMSVISFGGLIGNETGNNSCAAVRIMPNFNYRSLADDDWDFYRFTITEPTLLKIKISNFMSEGNLLAYFSGDCKDLGSNIGHEGTPANQPIRPNRVIDLAVKGPSEPGTYYVAVNATNANIPFNMSAPYTLMVEATAP